jgi:transposase
MLTISCLEGEVILGVDTHRGTHAAVLIDPLGRLLATETFATTRRGNRAMIAWAQLRGTVHRAGVEGTGSFGAGLTRALQLEGIEVIEVTRATRVGQDLIVTAPDDLREALGELTNRQLVARCARMHRSPRRDTVAATRFALRSLARRHQTLDAEIAELDAILAELTARAAPRLLKESGIGPEIAARMLLVAGDNPTRLRNDAALAALCGASPIEAASGKTTRHRLNRGGDRQGNSALWLIATNRMIHHPQTRDYVARRSAEGKSTKRSAVA